MYLLRKMRGEVLERISNAVGYANFSSYSTIAQLFSTTPLRSGPLLASQKWYSACAERYFWRGASTPVEFG
jgi:hypothetical protein